MLCRRAAVALLPALILVSALGGPAGPGPGHGHAAAAQEAPPAAAPRAPGVYVLTLGSGEVRGLGEAMAVAWAPDATRLAVAGPGPGPDGFGAGLRIIDLISGETTVVARPEQGMAGLLRWAPDGARLAFAFRNTVGAATNSSAALWVTHADGTTTRPLLEGGVLDLAWMPDGRGITVVQQLVDAQDVPSGRIATIDVGTGLALATVLASADAVCTVSLAWSTDGAYLAYSGPGLSQPCGDVAGWGVWVWEAATGTRRRLYAGAAGPLLWTDDGRLLAEVGPPLGPPPADPRASYALRVFRPETAGDRVLVMADPPRTLATPPWGFATAGEVVVYVLGDCDAASVWVVGTAGGTPRRLSPAGALAFRPRLAPDGRSVAWARVGDSGTDLVVADVDGNATRTLLAGAPALMVLGWLPGGGALAFAVTEQQERDCIVS